MWCTCEAPRQACVVAVGLEAGVPSAVVGHRYSSAGREGAIGMQCSTEGEGSRHDTVVGGGREEEQLYGVRPE